MKSQSLYNKLIRENEEKRRKESLWIVQYFTYFKGQIE